MESLVIHPWLDKPRVDKTQEKNWVDKPIIF